MGVEKLLLRAGDTTKKPTKGDTVEIEYTGWLYDEYAVDGKGKQFDTSKDRVDFVTEIGEGTVIKGWETSVLEMGLGEVAMLTISADFAYGKSGFPGHIPPECALVFEVKLKGIKRKDTEVWERAKTAT